MAGSTFNEAARFWTASNRTTASFFSMDRQNPTAAGLMPLPRTVELSRILSRRFDGFHFSTTGGSSARRAVKPATQITLIPTFAKILAASVSALMRWRGGTLAELNT